MAAAFAAAYHIAPNIDAGKTVTCRPIPSGGENDSGSGRGGRCNIVPTSRWGPVYMSTRGNKSFFGKLCDANASDDRRSGIPLSDGHSTFGGSNSRLPDCGYCGSCATEICDGSTIAGVSNGPSEETVSSLPTSDPRHKRIPRRNRSTSAMAASCYSASLTIYPSPAMPQYVPRQAGVWRTVSIPKLRPDARRTGSR